MINGNNLTDDEIRVSILKRLNYVFDMIIKMKKVKNLNELASNLSVRSTALYRLQEANPLSKLDPILVYNLILKYNANIEWIITNVGVPFNFDTPYNYKMKNTENIKEN